ncbi:DegV family protein [Cognatiluteimonas weifangensis]|uniref:DegV family EDD domain-containing protein n=1 Tax=Cognatiluteimonas weifangensis TaxID=2303539 RepID=A0A372DR20_9GAMM|nr:DegV family protein [Luteimonas weifangensis]RFP61817.1 DegV family EDD domain-containing protein [Luteimonas weifangensis]
MRIGLVVDSACDLPGEYFGQHHITLLPVTVHIGEDSLTDLRDEQETLRFLRSHIAERGADAETSPFTVQQIQELFLSKLVIDYDYVFCLTTARSRSAIFENATQASFAILNEYRPIRAAAGHDTPFALRVVDSQNVFAGQGVTAVEAVRLIEGGEGAPKIRARLENLALHTHAYMIAPDLHYLRARTRKRGDRSVSLFSAALGSALDIKPILHCNRGETGAVAKIKGLEAAAQRLFAFAGERVRRGLMTPTLCLSYGGDLAEMRALPGYEDLRTLCTGYNIEMFETVMGLTGMVNVGKGALVVGFAAEPHVFE